LVFQDAEGKEHKALRLNEKLFQGNDEDFSVGKIIRARILGDQKNLNDFELKAAGEGIGAAGGWMISEEVSARIIDLARNLSCVQKAGALTMPMPTAEMRLVKIASDPTAYWVAEHAEITESDWTLAPINLKAMTVGCLVRASLELLEDAGNSGTALEQSMAAALALAVDRVALLGDGVTEPRGLDHCTGVNLISMGTNGATLTNYDPFSNAVEDVADHNGQAGAVIFAPRTFYTLDRLKAATTNQPLLPPQSFIDLKKFVTNQVGIADTQGTATTASKAFVGDFSQILYGIRKPLEVEFTRQGGTGTFAKCESLIRCRMRLDVAVLRENHFTKILGII
jgi:HK97 family phage major capsid protein